MTPPARSFPQVYKDLGIDLGKLGCIMLDVEPIKVSDIIKPEDLYYSGDEGEHTEGNVSEIEPHVTLLYGLLRSGPEMKQHVDIILSGWSPEDITISDVSFFYANDPTDRFVAIIAKVVTSNNLLDANTRLGYLPHLNTFPDYQPHITLAYVKDTADWKNYVSQLNERLHDQPVRALGINYGD